MPRDTQNHQHPVSRGQYQRSYGRRQRGRPEVSSKADKGHQKVDKRQTSSYIPTFTTPATNTFSPSPAVYYDFQPAKTAPLDLYDAPSAPILTPADLPGPPYPGGTSYVATTPSYSNPIFLDNKVQTTAIYREETSHFQPGTVFHESQVCLLYSSSSMSMSD